ncbi:MAG: hypothetical protein J0I67_17140 [Bosea sp.]|nr:hypothetical protein [Bosea sp. (in: a-proteobacteria)]
MRRAVALRFLRDAGDGALDRDDPLRQPAITLGRRQAFDADAVGPIADEMEGDERRDQDQDGAARHGVGEAPFEDACHAGWPSRARTDGVNM